MLRRLQHTTDFDPEISLTGFLRQKAAIRGLVHTEDLGVRYGRPLIEALPELSEVLDVDLLTLEAIAPRSRSSDPARDYRFDRTHCDPYCPVCVSEARPWRKEWRHALVTACYVHQIRLRDDCDLCCERLRPNAGGVAHCGCGVPLKQNLCAGASSLEVAIAKAVAGQPVDLCGLEQTYVADAELGSLLFFLASSAVPTRTGKRVKAQKPKRISEAVEFMKPVEVLIDDWPNGIRLEVHKRWRKSPDGGQTSAQRLGAWHRGLFGFTGGLARVLQDEVVHTVQTEIGDPYLSKPEERSSYISVAKASRQLGMRAERIVEAVSRSDVAGRQHQSPQGHRHTLVTTSVVEQARANRKRFISRKQLNQLLGVSKKQSYLLTEAGVIAEVSENERPPLVDGSFDQFAVERAIDSIRAKVEHGSEKPENSVAFKDINLRRTTDKSALLELYGAIFRGELAAVHFPDDEPLAGVGFDIVEVDKFLKSFGRHDDMTASDVSKITGWKAECITHWCAVGLLEAEQGKSSNLDAWLIPQENLVEFQKRYLVLADLASSSGTTSRALLRRLGRFGIQTVGAMSIGSTSRGHLLRTESITVLLREFSERT